MAGAAEGTVQKILGHQSGRMTRHYTHLSPGFMQAEINRIQSAFENKSAKKQHNEADESLTAIK